MTINEQINAQAHRSALLHRLTEEESRRLKQTLLEIYDDVSDFCERNRLVYMLGGGSALGAVRHRGFIPWDDDLDLLMPRADYDQFIRTFLTEYGDKYELTAPGMPNESKNLFLKIYKRGTVWEEIIYSDCDKWPNGIYLDIFPVENTSDRRWCRKLVGYCSDVLSAVTTCTLYKENRGPKFRAFMSESSITFRNYKLRIFVGYLCSFASHRRWCDFTDRFVQYSNEKSEYTAIPTGREHYAGEILPRHVMLPVSYGEFEGRKIPLPNDVDAYLKNLYNDYMQLPPEEKRERHLIHAIRF